MHVWDEKKENVFQLLTSIYLPPHVHILYPELHNTTYFWSLPAVDQFTLIIARSVWFSGTRDTWHHLCPISRKYGVNELKIIIWSYLDPLSHSKRTKLSDSKYFFINTYFPGRERLVPMGSRVLSARTAARCWRTRALSTDTARSTRGRSLTSAHTATSKL